MILQTKRKDKPLPYWEGEELSYLPMQRAGSTGSPPTADSSLGACHESQKSPWGVLPDRHQLSYLFSNGLSNARQPRDTFLANSSDAKR